MENDDRLTTAILERERLIIEITLFHCFKNKEKLENLSSHDMNEMVDEIFGQIQLMKLNLIKW